LGTKCSGPTCTAQRGVLAVERKEEEVAVERVEGGKVEQHLGL
jgi:hypothetical protein